MTNNVKHSTMKRLTGIILSVMLIFALALTAGCEGGGNPAPSVTPSVSTSTTEEARELVIANGDFENVGETQEGETVSYPITSVASYNKSYDYNLSSTYKAPDESSSGASGIVDVSATFGDHTGIGLATDKNPGKCDAVINSDKDLGTHVLMLHNGKPTALRYTTATSVSLQAGTYAKISVWVYTTELKDVNGNDVPAGGNVGANVTVSSTSAVTVAGSSVTYDSVAVKNINTLGQWKEVTMYLAGSQLQATTVYVTLGLGKGTATDHDEFAQGYAFFDELTMEYVSRKDYLTAAESAETVNASLTGTQAAVNYTADKATAVNFGAAGTELISNSPATVETPIPTYDTVGGTAPVDSQGVKGVISLDEAKDVDEAGFENFPFAADSDILMIENRIATSYFSRSISYEIPANTCKAISVFVKTSALVGPKGASISLITIPEDPTNANDYVYNTHANINTSATDHSKDKNYFWDGWTQYTFFVRNNTAENIEVGLRYALGETDITNLSELDFTKGWAAFTNATMYDITSAQYNSASTSVSTNKKVDLYTGSYTNTTKGGFDTYFANNNTFTQEPAAPSTWKPVSGNCLTIGGTSEFYNDKTVSGLVNSAYWANYDFDSKIALSDWYDATTIGNNPLMIFNREATSFGYVSANKTLAANTSYQISVRVKVVGNNATAYFYLTTADLKAENPYAVKVMEVPASATNEEGAPEFALSFNEPNFDMSQTPELVPLGDGWALLSFYVTTGDTAVTYRAEVWNGDRTGTETSEGYVFFQDFEQTTVSADNMELIKEAYMDKYELTAEHAAVITYTRDKLEDETEDPEPAIVYMSAPYATFFDYTELDIVVADEEPDADEPVSDGTSCKASVDTSVLLWMSSLLIALILIIVLIVIILRSFKARLGRNKKTRVGGHFDADARKRQAQRIAEKREAARIKAEEERLAAEEAARKAEEKRLAAEEAARKAEEERLAAEEAAAQAEEAEEATAEAETAEEATAEEPVAEEPATENEEKGE
ncbi:MAG: hypothetical protein E7363_03330 [Clostridiales bacterium]|nr:hypothetical protein [Clostridiales bacterium]